MPRTFNNLSELLAALPAAVDRAIHAAAKDIGEGVERRAKNKLGEYQPGWAALSEQRKRERVAEGFPEDEPLLATGDLRGSIQNSVVRRVHSATIVVGSNAPQARIQEFGGPTAVGTYIPPRPYLAPAAVEAEDDMQRKVARALVEEFEKL